MDALVTLLVLVGTIGVHEVTGLLHCLECTHIIWNADDRNRHMQQLQVDMTQWSGNNSVPFSWVSSIDNMLAARASPACAADDPDNWNPQSDPNFQGVGRIGQVSEAVCPASQRAERCNFMYGAVDVYIPQYNKNLKLHMFVRNCRQVDPQMEDTCYDRNTNLGYSEIRTTFRDLLSFLGPGITVNYFTGRECLCSYNRCTAFTQGSQAVTGSVLTLLLTAIACLILKD